MRAFRSTIAALACIALTACAHMRPKPAESCVIEAYPLLVNAENHSQLLMQLFTAGKEGQPDSAGSFPHKVAEIVRTARDQGATEINALVLSGGSQHGLFGTGFLIGAQDRLPAYNVVTGISTGALQSTFAFLAPVARKRAEGDYPADLGAFQTSAKPSTSYLQDLAIASSITRERTILIKRPFGLVGGLVTGSQGSLRPLHDRIVQFIDDQTLDDIATEGAKGRHLFIGVTDVDNGLGYALDMVKLAQDSKRDRRAYRNCYADALVASSAVPLAAEPVSLTILDKSKGDVLQHLFVDGGARYSVFARDLADPIGQSPLPVNFDVIVNGFFFTGIWTNGKGDPVVDWDAVNLSKRVVDIVQNQVSRFSVDAFERLAPKGSVNRVRLAFINRDESEHFSYTIAAYPESETRFCEDWTKEDKRKENPLEFHPRYMACLLAYGVERGRSASGAWDLILPEKE